MNNTKMEMMPVSRLASFEKRYRQFSTLPERAWKYIDDTMINVAKAELVGIADLMGNPDTNITIDGTTMTVYTRERASEVNEASMHTSPDTRGNRGALMFDEIGVPLPVTFKDFPVDKRQINSARRESIPFRTTLVAESTRAVSRLLENTLFLGDYTAAGSTLYGYTTFPDRNLYTIPNSWATAEPDAIFADVNNMVSASMFDNHLGPWVLYIPWEYEARLNEDYTVGTGDYPTGQSISQRIGQISNLRAIRTSRTLPNNSVVLVELTSSTVQLINGLPMQVLDWEPDGSPNWEHTWKVLTMMVPFIYSDYNGQCGIVHGTV